MLLQHEDCPDHVWIEFEDHDYAGRRVYRTPFGRCVVYLNLKDMKDAVALAYDGRVKPNMHNVIAWKGQ